MIPVPVQTIDTLEDKRDEYKKAWVALFNAIDPRNIKAYMEGDQEFPGDSFYGNIEQLSDSVHYLEGPDTIAIFLKLKGEHLRDVGSQAYCCENNDAFGDSLYFIDTEEHQPYVKSESVLTWGNLYHLLIELTNAYRSRIPAPPKEPLY